MVRTNTVSVSFKAARAQQERRGRIVWSADSAQAAAQGWDLLPAGLLNSVLQVFCLWNSKVVRTKCLLT